MKEREHDTKVNGEREKRDRNMLHVVGSKRIVEKNEDLNEMRDLEEAILLEKNN